MGSAAAKSLDAATDEVMAVPRMIWSLVPEKLIRRRWVFPVAIEGKLPRACLKVAMLDVRDLKLADEIAFATGLEVRPVAMAPEALRRLITVHLGEEPDPSVSPRATEVVDAIELPDEDGPELELDSWLIPTAPGKTRWR